MANATFISLWDDGAFELDSPCTVDFNEMKLVDMEEYSAVWDDDGNEVVDGNEIDVIINTIEHLDEEFVETEDGTRYTVVPEDELDDAEDKYGNGIVVYERGVSF